MSALWLGSLCKNDCGDSKQRYLCRDSRKMFIKETETIFKSIKKDLSVWEKYIHCILEKNPLRKCTKECGITLYTAFTWQHKILNALQNMIYEITLDRVVKVDETFNNVSCKSSHKNFNLPRKSFNQKRKASKRSSSNEKVCIPCGIDLEGLSIAHVRIPRNIHKTDCSRSNY